MTQRTFKAVIKHGNGYRFSRKLTAWDMDDTEEIMWDLFGEERTWDWIFDRLRVPIPPDTWPEPNTFPSGYAGKSFARAAEAIRAATPPQVAAASRWAFKFKRHSGYLEDPETTVKNTVETFFSIIVPLFTDSKTVGVLPYSVHREGLNKELSNCASGRDSGEELRVKIREEERDKRRTLDTNDYYSVSEYETVRYFMSSPHSALGLSQRQKSIASVPPTAEDRLHFAIWGEYAGFDDKSRDRRIIQKVAQPNSIDAVCSVTYSRLCRRLGVDCVYCFYGAGLPVPGENEKWYRYVVVSKAYEGHMTFDGWRECGGTPQNLENSGDYYAHQLLSLLAHQHRGELDDFGYVLKHGHYLKAGNERAFSHARVRSSFAGHSFVQRAPMTADQIHEEMLAMDLPMSGARPAAEELASLTEDDIAAITQMPEGPRTPHVQELLRSELRQMRALAETLLKAQG